MDISNKSALLVAIFINLGGLGLETLGIKVAAWPLLIFSLFGIILVLVKNFLDSKHDVSVQSTFPLLNILALEKWAVKISDHFNYIKTITLYEAPFASHKKYVLFFNFDTSTVKGKNSKGTFDGHTWFNKWSKKNYPIDDSFKEIYKEKPPDDFFKEWLITTERPQGVNKRLSLVLYNTKNT